VKALSGFVLEDDAVLFPPGCVLEEPQPVVLVSDGCPHRRLTVLLDADSRIAREGSNAGNTPRISVQPRHPSAHAEQHNQKHDNNSSQQTCQRIGGDRTNAERRATARAGRVQVTLSVQLQPNRLGGQGHHERGTPDNQGRQERDGMPLQQRHDGCEEPHQPSVL
jgi:hypothetical protein